MIFKKITALLLSTVITVAMLTGCEAFNMVKSGLEATDNAAEVSDDSAQTSDPASYHDYDKGYKYMDGDKVIATINGLDITWDEYYTWIFSNVSSYESSYGKITDWSAAATDDMTISQYFVDYALQSIAYYKLIEYNAGVHRVILSEEDEAKINSNLDSVIQNYGGEEGFQKELDSMYITKENYEYLIRVGFMDDALFTQQYGEDGATVTDQEVLDYVKDDGYMMAKHILILTTDSNGNPLDDTAKAAALAKAQDILAQLQACPDSASQRVLFDQLMTENSEDPGLQYFPNGYLFVSGDMNEAFENAVTALGEYEISGIVESDNGYHIIMRLPIDIESTPIQYSTQGKDYSLRRIVAYSMYSEVVDGWYQDADIKKTDKLTNLDLAKLFGE